MAHDFSHPPHRYGLNCILRYPILMVPSVLIHNILFLYTILFILSNLFTKMKKIARRWLLTAFTGLGAFSPYSSSYWPLHIHVQPFILVNPL